jgi:putative FmdB family regulatory protein
MLTYEYECLACGHRFEREQSMLEEPLTVCPKCSKEIRRLISGGAGFVFNGTGLGRIDGNSTECALEHKGVTCCGREEPCGKSCESKEVK